MIAGFFSKIFGTANARQVRRLQPMVNRINEFEAQISALDDAQLAAKTNEFREQIANGKSLDAVLFEAFAVVREATKRRLGQRHFDVQLMGGIALHQGKISEMKTGEGKTQVAVLPLYLNALTGKGVHLITVNDYLARRDSEWMGVIYQSLGLTVGALQNSMNDSERQKIYGCDIMYATNSEVGFDYLRDNMKFRLQDYVQRELNYAIIDEVDSILIDEARTPLIISGSSDESSKLYADVDRVIARLKRDTEYEVDEKDRAVHLTEAGVDKIELAFSIPNLYAAEHLNILHHVEQALKAHALFKRDVEYVVKDGQVLIVDEFTGRILPGRRYSDGLHQAIEAKEGVEVEKETQTLAAITIQNYFRMYKKLAGMTGTAATEAEEFYRIYKLDVVSIPTNKPMIRRDEPDLIYLTKEAKYKAIVNDIKERYIKGQPVLIGTIAIETSEYLSTVLSASGVPHEVLNAKQHAREAEIVMHAGEPKHVTIATNMAGRGTDIKLTPESLQAGGLYILGTERHESRRIDNQLRGRSGRQGDPGESRFYISLEDDLIRIFAGDGLKRKMQFFGMTEDEVIESKYISKNIEAAQEKVEKRNFDARKHLLEYDDVLNQQRVVVYSYRREVLEGAERIESLMNELITQALQDAVDRFCPKRAVTREQREQLETFVAHMTGIDKNRIASVIASAATSDALKNALIQLMLKEYDLYRTSQNPEQRKDAEKWVMLETIDQAWKQHMLNLDHLREGIGLRGWGQKTPLIEYKREAFDMFKEMMQQIRADIVFALFHVQVERFDQQEIENRRERELEQLNFVSGDTSSQAPVQRTADKVGRNEPCPCGSGKKYKKCCGQ